MKSKALTNFRASTGKDDAIRLTLPKKMTLNRRSPISTTMKWSK